MNMHLRRRCPLDSHHDKSCFSESNTAGSHSDELSLPDLRQETESWKESTASSAVWTTSGEESSAVDDSCSLSMSVGAPCSGETESSIDSTVYSSNGSHSLSTSARSGFSHENDSTNESSCEESSLDYDCHSCPSSILAASVDSDESHEKIKTDRAATEVRLAPFVPPLHLLSRRYFKPDRLWLFDVGSHADERSHGTAETASIRWRPRDFKILDRLGYGKFGGVSLALDNGTYVALKLITKNHPQERIAAKYVKREVEIQTRLCHEHILQSFGYFHGPTSVTLVLEYAKYGNLSEYKRKEENKTLTIPKTVHFLRQIVSAVAYLESRHIAHRDIKPENIVLTTVSTAKLCDFGSSIHSPPSEMRTTLCGTPEFVSPELLTTPMEYAACHVDRWALGVLAYELVNGNTPFFVEKSEKERIAAERGYATDHQVHFDRIRAFSSLEVPFGITDRDHCNFYDFCSSLLQREPSDRMGAKDALNHPFLLSISHNQSTPHRSRVFWSRPTKRTKRHAI